MAASERIQQIQVEGLQNLEVSLNENSDKRRIFIMFIGAIDETGESWCSDCRDGKEMLLLDPTTDFPKNENFRSEVVFWNYS